MKKVLYTILAVIGLGAIVAGCQDDAKVASENLSKAANNFEVQRQIVVVNAFNGDYLFEVVGRCSVTRRTVDLVATCKHGPNDYRKHFIGITDNSPYTVKQMDGIPVSTYHTRITIKPQSVIPDFDFRGSAEELTTNSSELNQ